MRLRDAQTLCPNEFTPFGRRLPRTSGNLFAGSREFYTAATQSTIRENTSWKFTRKRLLLFWLWRLAPFRFWRRATHKIHHLSNKELGVDSGDTVKCGPGAQVRGEANGAIGKMASAGEQGNSVSHAF
jgi:hypothetical protein